MVESNTEYIITRVSNIMAHAYFSEIALSEDGLEDIFRKLAELDKSRNMPQMGLVFKGRTVPDRNYFHFYWAGFLGEERQRIILEGAGKNDENGELVEQRPLQVIPKELRDKATEVLGGELTLPHILSTVIEGAFSGKVKVSRLAIDGDYLKATLMGKPSD